jgi:hypothetical protein
VFVLNSPHCISQGRSDRPPDAERTICQDEEDLSKDRAAIIAATEELRFSAGNFYIK